MPNIKPEASFTTINEDCLRLIIFDYLKLEDQIALSQVCGRLREYIFFMWERSFRCLDLRKVHLTKENARYFLYAVSEFCEELILGSYELAKYERGFRANNFPRLKSVNANLSEDDLKCDDLVFLITVLFPNITKLKLRGRILGNYIYRLTDLKELHLDLLPGKKICYSHVARFLKTLPLEKFTYNVNNRDCTALREVSKSKTLKELSTNCQITEFDHAVQSSLQKVHKITFTDRLSRLYAGWPLKELTRHHGDNIKRLAFNCFTKCQEITVYSGIENMKSLDQVILSNMTYLNPEQLTHIIGQVPSSLTKFRYVKSPWNEDVELQLVLLVKRCSSLQLLDVSDTAAGLFFLLKLIKQINSKKHKETLLLRCHNAKIVPDSLELVNLPKNLDVAFEKQVVSQLEHGSFQIVLSKPSAKTKQA